MKRFVPWIVIGVAVAALAAPAFAEPADRVPVDRLRKQLNSQMNDLREELTDLQSAIGEAIWNSATLAAQMDRILDSVGTVSGETARREAAEMVAAQARRARQAASTGRAAGVRREVRAAPPMVMPTTTRRVIAGEIEEHIDAAVKRAEKAVRDASAQIGMRQKEAERRATMVMKQPQEVERAGAGVRQRERAAARAPEPSPARRGDDDEITITITIKGRGLKAAVEGN